METRELEILGGNTINNLDFLLNLTVPFTAITSEVLEASKKEFIEILSESTYKFTPKTVISYELEVLPLNAIPFRMPKEDVDDLLNCVAYTLARSGRFKKPAYIYKKEGSEFKIFSTKNISNQLKNKMIYVLSPRIKYAVESGNVETAIINMIESTRKHKITKGRGFCFLKSHMLVDGPQRRQLKFEVQTLFDYGIGNIDLNSFKIKLVEFKFIGVDVENIYIKGTNEV